MKIAVLLLSLGLACCANQPPAELVMINSRVNAMPYVANDTIRFDTVAFSCDKGNCLDYALCKLREMQKEHIHGRLFVYRLWNGIPHAIAVSDTGWALDNRTVSPYPAPTCTGVCWATDVKFKGDIAVYQKIQILYHRTGSVPSS